MVHSIVQLFPPEAVSLPLFVALPSILEDKNAMQSYCGLCADIPLFEGNHLPKEYEHGSVSIALPRSQQACVLDLPWRKEEMSDSFLRLRT